MINELSEIFLVYIIHSGVKHQLYTLIYLRYDCMKYLIGASLFVVK